MRQENFVLYSYTKTNIFFIGTTLSVVPITNQKYMKQIICKGANNVRKLKCNMCNLWREIPRM